MTTFSDKKAVLTYLEEQGFKVSRRTLYNHIDRGFLRQEPDGYFLQAQVDTYAAAKLKRKDGSSDTKRTDRLTRLSITEKEESIKKLKNQNRKAEIELRGLDNKWILKEEAFAKTAALVGLIRDSLRHNFHIGQTALVHVAGGDPSRAPELYEELETLLGKSFNDVATMAGVEVMFEEVEE